MLLVPYAASAGVRLAVEPLHPTMCAERSVVVTLDHALDIVERFDPAIDLGKFLADLDYWYDGYGQSGVDAAREQFLAGGQAAVKSRPRSGTRLVASNHAPETSARSL